MKVVAFNCSARADGNTAILIKQALGELESRGVGIEMVQLAGTSLSGCIACYKCFKNKDGKCAVKKDKLNSYVELMIEADGIILGSPSYFADLTANAKALIERAGMVSRANVDILKRKLGAAVVAERRAGAMHVFHSLNSFFLISQMIVVGSSYWNIGRGRDIGEVTADEEGMATMRTLGQNMAWLLEKIAK